MKNEERPKGAIGPKTECLHCGAVHPRMLSIPLATDDAAWQAIAKQHKSDCHWVKTRAGRVSAGSKPRAVRGKK